MNVLSIAVQRAGEAMTRPSASMLRWLKHAGAGDPGAWTPTMTLYSAWRAWVERVGRG
jgi:hypothetical protein